MEWDLFLLYKVFILKRGACRISFLNISFQKILLWNFDYSFTLNCLKQCNPIKWINIKYFCICFVFCVTLTNRSWKKEVSKDSIKYSYWCFKIINCINAARSAFGPLSITLFKHWNCNLNLLAFHVCIFIYVYVYFFKLSWAFL